MEVRRWYSALVKNIGNQKLIFALLKGKELGLRPMTFHNGVESRVDVNGRDYSVDDYYELVGMERDEPGLSKGI